MMEILKKKKSYQGDTYKKFRNVANNFIHDWKIEKKPRLKIIL